MKKVLLTLCAAVLTLTASAQTRWHDAAELTIIGKDHIATADGTHPTDLGFTYMLQTISPKLKKILKKYGIK